MGMAVKPPALLMDTLSLSSKYCQYGLSASIPLLLHMNAPGWPTNGSNLHQNHQTTSREWAQKFGSYKTWLRIMWTISFSVKSCLHHSICISGKSERKILHSWWQIYCFVGNGCCNILIDEPNFPYIRAIAFRRKNYQSNLLHRCCNLLNMGGT